MDIHDYLAEVGIDLGRRGDPRAPVRQALDRIAVHLCGQVISQLRGSRHSGSRTLDGILWAARLHADDASKKTDFALRLARAGVDKQWSHAASGSRYVWYSNHYTTLVAEQLGYPRKRIERLFLALRADLAFSQYVAPDNEMRDFFCARVLHFMSVRFSIKPTGIPLTLVALSRAWDHRTVPSFYQAFYGLAGNRLVSAWLPYEVVTLRRFYELQSAAGNHLTPFDQLLLEASVHRSLTIPQVCDAVEQVTGVPLLKPSVTVYRQLLAYGQPIAPLRRPTPPSSQWNRRALPEPE